MTLFYYCRGLLPVGLPRFCGLWNFPAHSCEAATGRENLLSKRMTRSHDLSSPISFSSYSIGWRPRLLTQSLEVSCLVWLWEVLRLWMVTGLFVRPSRLRRQLGLVRAATPSLRRSLPRTGAAAPITLCGKMTKMRRKAEWCGAKEEAGGQKTICCPCLTPDWKEKAIKKTAERLHQILFILLLYLL